MEPDIRRAILKQDGIKSTVKNIMKTSPFTIPCSLSDEARIKMTIESGKVLVPVVDISCRVVDYVFLLEILELESYKQATCSSQNYRGVFPPSSLGFVGTRHHRPRFHFAEDTKAGQPPSIPVTATAIGATL